MVQIGSSGNVLIPRTSSIESMTDSNMLEMLEMAQWDLRSQGFAPKSVIKEAMNTKHERMQHTVGWGRQSNEIIPDTLCPDTRSRSTLGWFCIIPWMTDIASNKLKLEGSSSECVCSRRCFAGFFQWFSCCTSSRIYFAFSSKWLCPCCHLYHLIVYRSIYAPILSIRGHSSHGFQALISSKPR